ncbi:MAG: DeoR/GlpR family DNA-binding transcription regulator [Lachnospiraceae bacterium]|nr:DeoR/GlpR family DNA-binding transcription regulator [Lachnospiraceae bacterium]
MLTEERQHLILKQLEEQKAVKVIELTELLGASESTIRRDLNYLDQQGKLVKVHGGATVKEQSMTAVEYDMTTKSALNLSEKQRIAQYSASLIEKDDFVYIDAGSTTEYMIDYIEQPAEYVTNGISHARKLAMKGFRVHLLGGEYKLATEAIIGIEAVRSLSAYHFTKAFMGTNGISIVGGFSTPDTQEACVKGEAIHRAYQAYVLADHTKFNMDSCITFAKLKEAQILTDQKPAQNYEDYTVVKEV